MFNFFLVALSTEPAPLSIKPISPSHNVSRRKTICGANFNEFPQNCDNLGICVLKNKVDFDFLEPSMLGIKPQPPKWPEREELIRASIRRRVNSVDIPLSLRMIKKRQKMNEGIRDRDDSIKKVHYSMVFYYFRATKTH